MKIRMDELREVVREVLNEDLKNVGGKHEKTVAGAHVLKMMHDAPGVMQALMSIGSPKELAHVIEAIIDAVPVVRRDEVLKALSTVTRHEKTTHRR